MNMHSSTFWTGGHSASVRPLFDCSEKSWNCSRPLLDGVLGEWGGSHWSVPPPPLALFLDCLLLLVLGGPVFRLVRDAGSGGVQGFIFSPGFLHLAYVMCSLAGGLTFLYLGFSACTMSASCTDYSVLSPPPR